MPEDKKLAVLDLLARHEVPLIEDDIYGDIYFGAERPRPFMALDGAATRIYCSSFSKTLAPGYRIGWIAAGRRMQRGAGAQVRPHAVRPGAAAGGARRLPGVGRLRQPSAPHPARVRSTTSRR